MIEEERSESSTRCIMNSFRNEFLVLRVDSINLMIEGMLFGPWIQANTRNSSNFSFLELKEFMSTSLRRVLSLMPRAGL